MEPSRRHTRVRPLDDDARFRHGLAIVLGATLAVLPLLFGVVDVETFVIASAIGGIGVLPLWRHVGGPLSRPLPLVAFVGLFVLGPAIVIRELPYLAVWIYFGAFCFTLGLLRFLTDWREP